jgi:ABC-type transport system involved in multi-copper enzyme maturation permease subunit
MTPKRILLTVGFGIAGLMVGFGFTPGIVGAMLVALGFAGVGFIVPIDGDTLGVAEYAWRLVPANPILLRVVESAGKRRRDLFVRCGYLALLILVVIFALIGSGGSLGTGSLTALAQVSASLFQQMSYLQLGLVALLAPIFTAGAITQEKDSQTYDILLSTPLSNGQIVLGSLLSRLFFVVALLISGIPIFSITQIFGGVAIRSIVLSFLIAAATTFVTGSLAMAIATFKVGTRRTIFSFYLFIVIYLVGGFLLDRLDFFHFDVLLDASTTERSKTSWLTGIHPFLALRTLFNEQTYIPPDPASLPAPLRGWPWGWYLSRPDTFYVSFMFLLSAVLTLPSILLLRRMAQSTTSIKSLILQKLKLSSGETTRKPRVVWNNPIAWREAKTKASASRASLLRYGFIAAGMTGAIVLAIMFSQERLEGEYITPSSYDVSRGMLVVFTDRGTTYKVAPQINVTVNKQPATTDALSGRFKVANRAVGTKNELTSIDLVDIPRKLSAAETRSFLLGAIIVEFAVILLIVTNAAASTVTREKEDGSLDMLLTTPITSRYYIWGKLRGLVSYVLPLVAVPVASAIVFICYDMLRYAKSPDLSFQWIILPEAVIILPGLLIIVAAFASILGMQMSLRCRTTVRAVMSSVGIVLGICGALGWCGYSALDGFRAGEASLVIGSFSPFTILTVLIDPTRYGGRLFQPGGEASTGRIIVLIFSWIATGGYAVIVWTMYKGMVKNFDMTIRRQSR